MKLRERGIDCVKKNSRRLLFVFVFLVFLLGISAPLYSRLAVSVIKWAAGILGVDLHGSFSVWLEYYAQFFATSISALTAYLLIYTEILQNRTNKKMDCIIEDSPNIQYSKALISACKYNYEASLKGYIDAMKKEKNYSNDDRFQLEMLKDKKGNHAIIAVRMIQQVATKWTGMKPSVEDFARIRIRTNPSLEIKLVEFINAAIDAMDHLARRYDCPMEGLFDHFDWFHAYISNDEIKIRIDKADTLMRELNTQLETNTGKLRAYGIIEP